MSSITIFSTPMSARPTSRRKKKEYKQRTKEQKKGKTARSRVFVLDFDGDIRASAVEHLREEISAVVQVARPEDEVLLRLDNPGGQVHYFRLAAFHIRPLK